MTTRKTNMIRKASSLGPATFAAILNYVEATIDTADYTARQIAAIMDMCYAQSEYGYYKCARENSIY